MPHRAPSPGVLATVGPPRPTYARLMTAARRWCLVALGVALLLGTPLAVRALPADDTDITATELLTLIQGSDSVPYSGLVESIGTLQLPVADEFSEIADLLGERTRLRVWWQDEHVWRVDAIEPAGETDLFHDSSLITSWDYESERATTTAEPRVRLPRASDLLPPQLGLLALRDARPDEVSRLPAARIAGIDAPGLRLVPTEEQSTIGHVDVWADPETGLPLRVEAFADGAELAAAATSFVDVSFAAPPDDVVRFTPPPGADLDVEDAFDVAAGADQFSPLISPPRLAGLDSRPGAVNRVSAVGDYGRGVTRMLAVPLWEQSADPLREQLESTPGVMGHSYGLALTVGPLNLLLTPDTFEDDRSYLLAGTVTEDTLQDAAGELLSGNYLVRVQGR